MALIRCDGNGSKTLVYTAYVKGQDVGAILSGVSGLSGSNTITQGAYTIARPSTSSTVTFTSTEDCILTVHQVQANVDSVSEINITANTPTNIGTSIGQNEFVMVEIYK